MDGRLIEDWIWTWVAILFYAPVANGAVLWLYQSQGEYAVRAHTLGFHVGADLVLGGVAGAGLVGAFALLARTGPGAALAEALAQLPGRAPPFAQVLAVFTAAIGEELLFRAVLQPRVGIAIATGLFVCAHVPWRRSSWIWPLTAVVTGSVLGALYAVTEAVLAGVVAQIVLGLLGPPVALRVIASASKGSAR